MLASRASWLGIALVGSAAGRAFAAGAQELLALEAEASPRLLLISPTEGSVSVLGNPTFGYPGGMAVHPDGTIYVVSYVFDSLWTLEPTSGRSSYVANLSTSIFEGGLAISPSGAAYIANQGFATTAALLSLDLHCGATAPIGLIGSGAHDLNGLAWRSDGKLIGLDRVDNALLVIDPFTAAVEGTLPIAPIVGGVGGLAVRNGIGYLATAGPAGAPPGSNEVFQVNLFTGALKRIASLEQTVTGIGIGALSAGPSLEPTVYCTAKPNSLGCIPRISSAGSSSAASRSGFLVQAVRVRNRKPGVLCYSTQGADAQPFQGGVLCMRAPVQRGPAVDSNGNPQGEDCSGVYTLDLNALAAGLLPALPAPELRIPGTMVQAQWWGRDKQGLFASTLSDALGYTVGP